MVCDNNDFPSDAKGTGWVGWPQARWEKLRGSIQKYVVKRGGGFIRCGSKTVSA